MANHIVNSSVDSNPIIVGETRIRDADGFVGTVVYVGPVASAKNPNEDYAGIVWDDKSRGKHDGSVISRATNQLVRHFQCQPTHGSFLRLHKLDRGVTLTADLLQHKYVGMQAPVIAPNNLLPHTARTSRGNEKPIELLGEMKIRQRQQLDNIHKISLRHEGISRVDENIFSSTKDESKVQDLFQNFDDIDLAGNLLSNWEEALKIMQLFPNVRDFSLAYNRVRDVTVPTLSPALTSIKILNLNHCGIKSFQSVLWIAKSMPTLQSLCLASSDLSDMTQHSPLGDMLPELKILDCSDCQLSSWVTQVMPYFGKLHSLEQLSLDGNPIQCITDKEIEDQFKSLQYIQLARTSISIWNDLEGLNKLNVQALRLKNTPLTSAMGQGEVRFLTIARIPTLQYLNGSSISSKEKIEAERRYVTMIAHLEANLKHEHADEISELTQETKKLYLEHPQYERLLEKHKGLVLPGVLRGEVEKNGSNNSMASTICNVIIRSMAASSCSMDPLSRRLPGTLSVGRLKALCARVFGIDVDSMSLHFRTEADAFPVELENDDNTLSYYGVCDGAEILINEVNPEDRQQKMKRLTVEQDQRIKEQEQAVIAFQDMKRKQNS